MIDLHPTSGLPLTLDDSCPALPLRLDGALRPGELDVRALADLRPALEDPKAAGPDPAYSMYRGLALFSAMDPDSGRTYRWRYDVTVFPPGRLGSEYLRTVGHYHLPPPGGSQSYPEVYEVLHGTATFLLQRVDDIHAGPSEVRVLDFLALEAPAGTKAMMLPDYGHWTVNAAAEPLVVSNWICADCVSDYEPMRRTRGPCWQLHCLLDEAHYVRNPLYAHRDEELTLAQPRDVPELGLVAGVPIFADLLSRPLRWRYLCAPEEAPLDLRSAIEVTKRVTP